MTKTISIVASVLAAAALALPACSSSEEGATPANGDTDGGDPSGPRCGRLTTPCEPGEVCEGAPDCKSSLCREGTCRATSPSDGAQNGSETDVDCGGDSSPACTDGKKCLVADDCGSGVCTGGVCQAPTPTDGVKNGDETDKDCGGSKAPKCKTGQGCGADGDCDGVRCDTTQKKCKGPADDDGLKNGDETGIDCGGPTTPKKCPPDQGCVGDGDCANTRCNTAKKCDPPKATDGLKNGTESDVDCGGGAPTNAPRCKEGGACAADGDCADPFCSFDNKCVTGRSCKGTVGTATSGITTCGRAGATETCCRSLKLPTSSARLDKYEVTAGRFRQFIETVGPNIRKWVTDEITANSPAGQRLAADIPADLRPFLPASATPGDPMNLVMQVGGTVMDSRRPSTSQGCYSSAGSSGSNTYWWPQSVLTQHFNGHSARLFTQAQYDEKSMNCSPYWMYAAFCAWDGGRLPTYAEIRQVWTGAYPWGSGYGGPGQPVTPANGINYETTINLDNESLYFYMVPGVGAAPNFDLAGYIAAPGRFFLDATTVKSSGQSWQDLGANTMEMLAIAPGASTENFCDFNVFGEATSASCVDGTERGVLRSTSVKRVQWIGGSWEGHGINTTTGVHGSYGAQTQYSKTGFRCVR